MNDRYPTGRIIKIKIAGEVYRLNLTEARVLRKMLDEEIFIASIQRDENESAVCTGGIVPTTICRAVKDDRLMHFWYFIKDPDFSIMRPSHCWLLFNIRWFEEINQEEWVKKYRGRANDEMIAVIELVNRYEVFPVYWKHMMTAEAM